MLAQPLELLLLQHAEQLGLQLRRDVADLVEEQVPWCASSKRPTFWLMAPVKAPFSWPNSSLSRRPVGMAAQLSLTKVRLAARAQVVKGAGDELLARAGLAADEDGGAGGGDRLDLLEDPAQGGALPDDLAEVVLGADLLLQVGLLLASWSLSASISWKARAFSTATATWLATSCRKPTSAAS